MRQFATVSKPEWHETLLNRYDHDPDEAVLMARLSEQHPNTLPLVRLMEDEADRELFMSSFRLVV